MALRATPTIAICLTAGIAAGIALARPGDSDAPAPAAAVEATETAADTGRNVEGDPDSPYLADADSNPLADDDTADDAIATPAAPAAVSIEGFAFSSLEPVAPGSTIEVTNLDSAPHTLTATNGEFDTGNIDQNQTVTITAPSAPGTYEFFCAIHPSMTGQLVVS